MSRFEPPRIPPEGDDIPTTEATTIIVFLAILVIILFGGLGFLLF